MQTKNESLYPHFLFFYPRFSFLWKIVPYFFNSDLSNPEHFKIVFLEHVDTAL